MLVYRYVMVVIWPCVGVHRTDHVLRTVNEIIWLTKWPILTMKTFYFDNNHDQIWIEFANLKYQSNGQISDPNPSPFVNKLYILSNNRKLKYFLWIRSMYIMANYTGCCRCLRMDMEHNICISSRSEHLTWQSIFRPVPSFKILGWITRIFYVWHSFTHVLSPCWAVLRRKWELPLCQTGQISSVFIDTDLLWHRVKLW